MTARILHIIPTLDQGGAEKQLTMLATRLPRERFDIHVCALTRSGPLAEPLVEAGLPLQTIGKRWKVDPAAYLRLVRVIRRLRPQLVHTWLFAANAYGRQAARQARVPHIVAAERCVDRWKVWHELALDRHLARCTDRIVTNSSGVVDFYVRHGIDRAKFEVIPNGIEVQPGAQARARADVLQELQLPADARLIGAVGRLWPQKGYKDLIWAAELLKVVRSDTHLLIIGEGPQYAQLLRWRDGLEIADRVHFLGHRRDVAALLPHLSCFWLGSAYEGQSNALMEAMAAGVPVVATDIPGNRDLVVPDETGLLFRVGDRATLARVTHRLLDDPVLAQRLGQAAQRRMREYFGVGQMVDRHAALYDRLLASR
ncbi:MAG: glycosyltransferase [Pirellulaceae bacterium]|jgi:glycosyltransferase involved in cell wall biosynthesis|nr:glycosyltransferase [Pirellulaceae bacterium]